MFSFIVFALVVCRDVLFGFSERENTDTHMLFSLWRFFMFSSHTYIFLLMNININSFSVMYLSSYVVNNNDFRLYSPFVAPLAYYIGLWEHHKNAKFEIETKYVYFLR